jgi:hypothetical protein
MARTSIPALKCKTLFVQLFGDKDTKGTFAEIRIAERDCEAARDAIFFQALYY